MSRPAILLGSGPRVVLTIARSLRRRGIPVIVALTSADDRWTTSRAVSRVVRLHGTIAERCAQLEALVRESGASWVAPCSDTALLLLAECHERLAALAHVAAPPPGIVATVLDKARTIACARSVGVPVPQAYAIASRADLEAQGELPFPLVAKPADKSRRALHDFKVRYFESRAELDAAFARQEAFGEGLVFQAFVPGAGVGVEVLMDDGEALAVFQHRRLRELPASGGVAVAAVAEAVDPTLREHAVRLLRALRWRGVAMVEFRHDASTGQAALMEVNGRFWGSLALPVHAGYDFPWWQWQLDHGQRPAVPAGYRVGTRLRWGTGDLLRLEGLLAGDGQRTAGIGPGRAIAAFLADFRPGVRPALWSWSDPLPAIAEAAHATRRIVRRVVATVVSRVVPSALLEDVRLARQLGGTRGRIFFRARMVRRLGGLHQRLPDPWHPHHVLFVCHGNIMRSAFAAELLRRRLADAAVSTVVVESAGVHARQGRAAHPRVQALAPEFQVDLSAHGARLIDERMIAAADTIFVMDDRNVAHLLARFPEARAKTFYLGGVRLADEYAAREIADPYEGDLAASRAMMDDVCACVGVLAEALASRADRSVVEVA